MILEGMMNDVWSLRIYQVNFFNSTNNQSIEWTWQTGNATLDSSGSWPDSYPSTNNIPRARSDCAVVSIDLKAYIFGGRTRLPSGDIAYMGDLLMLHYWDTSSWEIIAGSTTPSLPSATGLPSYRYGMVFGENVAQKLFTMIGGSADGTNPMADTWIYMAGNGSNIDASNIHWATSSIQTSFSNPSGTNPSGTNPSGTNPSGTNPSGTNPSGTASSRGTSEQLTSPLDIGSNGSKIAFWVWIIIAVVAVAVIVIVIVIIVVIRRRKSNKAEPSQGLMVEIGVSQSPQGNNPPGKPSNKDLYTTPGNPTATRKPEDSYTTLSASPTASPGPPPKSNDYTFLSPVATQSTGLAKEYDLSSMKDLDFIPSTEIKVGQSLGEGSFGIVYKGNWRGTSVALKNLKKSQMESLVAEASLMK